jgi:serine/threonine protein kinase
MSDLSDTQLGPYYLRRIIGKGGMATVYQAHQPSMDRDVAIKIIASELAGDPEFVARFEREAQVIARLQHPHILPVYDFGQTYLVMRLMEGGNLADELRQGARPVARVRQLTEQIAAALDYAHLRGIVHRDLKPTNILLDDLGNAYLTDFGIAKLLAGGTTGLTATGQVMGTPTYMAPEQWRSEPVDGRTDVYALGVIVYQMLLGQVPFSAETPHSLMYLHLDAAPPPPHNINPDLPRSLEPVIANALAKSREDRYASALDVARDLEHALQAPSRLPEQTAIDRTQEADQVRPEPVPPAPVPPPPSYAPPVYTPPPRYAEPPRGTTTSWFWIGALVIVALVLVGGAAILGAYWLSSPGDDDGGGALPPPPTSTRNVTATVTALPPTMTVPSTARPASPVPNTLPPLATPVPPRTLPPTITPAPSPTPTVPTSTPAPSLTPTFDPRYKPAVRIDNPADGAVYNLGETVLIDFTATVQLGGVERVELRRFDQVVDLLPGGNQPVFQNVFVYQPDTTGTYTLDVIAYARDAQGDLVASAPVTITILVQ